MRLGFTSGFLTALVLLAFPACTRVTDSIDVTAAEMTAVLENPDVLRALKKRVSAIKSMDHTQDIYRIIAGECNSSYRVKSHVMKLFSQLRIDSMTNHGGGCRDLWRAGPPPRGIRLTLDTTIAEIKAIVMNPKVQEKLRHEKNRPTDGGIVGIAWSETFYKVFFNDSCWIAVDVKSHDTSGTIHVDSVEPRDGSCDEGTGRA